jgi:hypothetical protein
MDWAALLAQEKIVCISNRLKLRKWIFLIDQLTDSFCWSK